jgi:hypothetical protein
VSKQHDPIALTVAMVAAGLILGMLVVLFSILGDVRPAHAHAHDDCETTSTVHEDDECPTPTVTPTAEPTSTPTVTPTSEPTVEPTLPVEPTATPTPCPGTGNICVPAEPTCAPGQELQPSSDTTYVCGPADRPGLPETGDHGLIGALIAATLLLWGTVFLLGARTTNRPRYRRTSK